MKWLKDLIAGLLAGSMLALVAFPSRIESLPNSLVAIFACLLSVAVTSLVLYLLRWPRMRFEVRLSLLTAILLVSIFSIGLGLFLWRVTLRVEEIFTLGLPFAALLVMLGAVAYLSLCYFLLLSANVLEPKEARRPKTKREFHQLSRAPVTRRSFVANQR